MANLTWRQLKQHIDTIDLDHIDDNVTIYLSEMDEYYPVSDVIDADCSYLTITA